MTRNDLIKNASNLKGFKVKKARYFMHGKRQAILVKGHVDKRFARRCPHCGKICPGYDTSSTLKRIRSLDFGTVMVFIEYPSERVQCPEHGVVTAQVPFARHKARHTRDFEDMVAAKSKESSFSAVAREMGISWHSVETIVGNVAKDVLPAENVRFNNLKSIGIDETSYKKGHKYITVVVDHATSEVIYAADKHGTEVLEAFFEKLTPAQRASIETVTGDGARWIKSTVEKYTDAQFCIDRFHVTQWAIEAMDKVRKSAWRIAKERQKAKPKNKVGRPSKAEAEKRKNEAKSTSATAMKGSKYALGKNPENLTEKQKETLELIRGADYYMFRAWELKEHLRRVFTAETPKEIRIQLKGWMSWASKSKIPEFVELSKKIRRHEDAIIRTAELGLSNARIEAVNNKIKVLIKRAYGFRNVDNLCSLVKLYTAKDVLKYPGRDRVWPKDLLEMED